MKINVTDAPNPQDEEYVIDDQNFLSQAVNTPFTGWKAQGDTMYTFVDGQLVWQKGE